jgi:hypothetical protein
MGHDWKPEEWREMDAGAVANCLGSYDARCCVEGQEWIRLVPTTVLAQALCDVDLHHQHAVCYEAARRMEALEAELFEAKEKHQKAFEDGLEMVRKANFRLAVLEAENARLREESADTFFDAWGGRLDADPALFRYDGVTFTTALARWQDWRAARKREGA